ncbi:MAG: hypothetical protein KC518_00340 [Candidatus Cloacimonetes bacterium]|nr:hypothetical protein [Candidatus Cloacimonadota bacterium]
MQLPIRTMIDQLTPTRTLRLPIWISCAGVPILVLHAMLGADWPGALQRLALTLMLAGATLLCGGLVGFLFGFPRARPSESHGEGAGPQRYRANTNLEEVSDWLSKILLGVGLVQINKLGGLAHAIAAQSVQGFAGGPGDIVFVVALLAYYLICGFLLGFLATRLVLATVFEAVDDSQELSEKIALYDRIEDQLRPEERAEVMNRRRHAESRLASMLSSRDSPRGELDRSAREYESLRRLLPTGSERTMKMSEVVARVRSLAGSMNPSVESVKRIFGKGGDGDRVVALALLESLGSGEAADIVEQALEQSRSSFEQYLALRVARQLVDSLDTLQRQRLLDLLQRLREGRTQGVAITPDSDRWEPSERLLERLARGN